MNLRRCLITRVIDVVNLAAAITGKRPVMLHRRPAVTEYHAIPAQPMPFTVFRTGPGLCSRSVLWTCGPVGRQNAGHIGGGSVGLSQMSWPRRRNSRCGGRRFILFSCRFIRQKLISPGPNLNTLKFRHCSTRRCRDIPWHHVSNPAT